MGVKRSFNQILALMADKRTYHKGLSVLLMVIMTLQLAVVPANAAFWQTESQEDETAAGETTEDGVIAPENEPNPAEPALKNTLALVVATGGQSGESIQYFKVIYEDTNGIRRSEYVLKEDSRASFVMAREYSNSDARREMANQYFNKQYDEPHAKFQAPHELDVPMQSEKRDIFLFETVYEVERILGVEIMQNAGKWDCQGLWVYQVDKILGEEMYGYVSEEGFINFSGWRLAELEMSFKNGQLIYTTLQTSRPKLYRMGENSNPDFNLIIYDKSEAEYESTNARQYAMRLEITDVFGAGMDKINNSNGVNETLEGIKFKNSLHMSIRYQDTFGCVQNVTVPVFPSSFIWALDNGVPITTKIAGYAQQGDTLLFPVTLPFFADLLKVELHYEGIAAGEPIDEMSLSSVSMYDLALSLADVGVDEARAAIVPTITYNPIYLWTTSSRQGYVLTSRETGYTFDMHLNENSIAIVDEPIEDEYMVEITTDEMPTAATTGDVSVKLTYVTYNGTEMRTEKIMLREQSKDVHGNTPGAEDMYYWMGMRPGGTLQFRIKIPYVSHFTGVTFELENGNTDEWQLGGLNIYRLEEVSRREVTWGHFIISGFWTDRYYSRSFKGDMIFTGTKPLLVQQGNPMTMDTSDGGVYSESALPDASVSWGDIKYSMSYEESLQNIGFTNARNTYQVEVTVAGNTALAGTEDAGSKNQFYFQLIFQDGTSGYVLANQQLSGDGFRTGYTETFIIKTNQDYGELVSVRIIPEDVSSKSDSFDKLHVESIQVMRRSDGGLSRQWSVERVGWIDIDFRDEGAYNSMMGQPGRTEEEMSRSFNVTYSTYAVNLLVSLTTLAIPFSGTVYGDICYYNGAGEVKHKGFDIVELMYDYANKAPRYASVLGTNGNTSAGIVCWSDDYMFRADHTDRFIVTLSDARELAYLDIEAYSDALEEGEGGTWHIGGVAVSLIESEGNLLLNANDEYERDNSTQLLTSNVDTNRIPAYQLLLEHNATTSQRINFIENQINLDIKHDSASVLGREPISQNDVLNIFVYPNLEESEASTEYSIRAAATYTSPHGMRQASAGVLNLSEDGTMFYAMGVKATGMTVLNDLSLLAESATHTPSAYISHAVIQQIRSDVIINTYEIDFSDGIAAYGLSSAPSNDMPGYEKAYIDEQVVMLSIGEGLDEPIMLQPETQDMAIALSYLPEYALPGQSKEFDTPFIYLTDQQVTMLRSGQTVSVTFNETFIKEITGVVMVATGGLSVPVNMACVGTYRVAAATGERVEGSWHSFSQFNDGITGTAVSRVDRRLGYAGDSVKPLKLRFVTAPATEDAESGVNSAVEMTISYVDDYGTTRTAMIPDLRLYATTQSPFATDSVTEVEMLVSGMKELRWLEIRPYDDKAETDLRWKLSSVSAQLGLTGEVQKRSVDDTKAIQESSGRKINFSNIAVVVDVYARSNTGEDTNTNATNETVNILLDSGQSARLQVYVAGSDEGFTVKAERASDAAATATADAGNFLTQNDDTLIFNPDRNYTGANIYYRITVTSVEVGTKSVINFVQGFEKESERESASVRGDDTAVESGSGSGAGSDAAGESDSGSASETP